MDQPQQEASFISTFKKNREKQYNQFLKVRRARLRSPVFDLPEFDESPLLSIVLLVKSHIDFKIAQDFIKSNSSSKEVEISILFKEDQKEFKPPTSQVANQQVDLKVANYSTSLNEMVIKATGKVVCLFLELSNLNESELFEMVDQIKESESNLVCIQEHNKKVSVMVMTSEIFLLARGIDELIKDLDIGLLDLGMRAEMLGCQIMAPTWPILDIPFRAVKNTKVGRLAVNQGTDKFHGL